MCHALCISCTGPQNKASVKLRRKINQSSSLSVLSCICLCWSREAKYLRSPASSCSACASFDSNNPVQVWIFMVLAPGVPDSWECNQTSHEKTAMCHINQPTPEGKACNQVPKRERRKKEVYYPCTFCIWAEHISLCKSCSYIMGEKEKDRWHLSTCLSFHCIVQDISDVMQRTI